MGNKNSSKGLNDRINDFTGAVVAMFVAICIILYIIYKFITEVLIPFLIGVFLIAVALVLTIFLARLLVQLIAYLTLERRCRRRIAALSKNLSQLRANDFDTRQRIAGWPDAQRLSAEASLRQRAETASELTAQRQNAAIALADHLADRLARVDKARRRASRKLTADVSDKLNRKLDKKNGEAALLGLRIDRLRNRYYIEPDPAFERKRRKYPAISEFDRFVSDSLRRWWNRRAGATA